MNEYTRGSHSLVKVGRQLFIKEWTRVSQNTFGGFLLTTFGRGGKLGPCHFPVNVLEWPRTVLPYKPTTSFSPRKISCLRLCSPHGPWGQGTEVEGLGSHPPQGLSSTVLGHLPSAAASKTQATLVPGPSLSQHCVRLAPFLRPPPGPSASAGCETRNDVGELCFCVGERRGPWGHRALTSGRRAARSPGRPGKPFRTPRSPGLGERRLRPRLPDDPVLRVAVPERRRPGTWGAGRRRGAPGGPCAFREPPGPASRGPARCVSEPRTLLLPMPPRSVPREPG
jgi:hypothetical protein